MNQLPSYEEAGKHTQEKPAADPGEEETAPELQLIDIPQEGHGNNPSVDVEVTEWGDGDNSSIEQVGEEETAPELQLIDIPQEGHGNNPSIDVEVTKWGDGDISNNEEEKAASPAEQPAQNPQQEPIATPAESVDDSEAEVGVVGTMQELQLIDIPQEGHGNNPSGDVEVTEWGDGDNSSIEQVGEEETAPELQLIDIPQEGHGYNPSVDVEVTKWGDNSNNQEEEAVSLAEKPAQNPVKGPIAAHEERAIQEQNPRVSITAETPVSEGNCMTTIVNQCLGEPATITIKKEEGEETVKKDDVPAERRPRQYEPGESCCTIC